MKKILTIIQLALIALTGCSSAKFKIKNIFSNEQNQKPQATTTLHMFIFIHGTILPYPSPESVFSSIKKTLQSGRRDKISWHDRFIYELRFKSIYKYQPIQEYGLHKINYAPITESSPYFYSFVTASMFQNILNNISTTEYRDASFYTFGWDGKLSNQSRVDCAKKLYKSLFDEIQKLKASYKKINITILAHSHGGNVALNLVNAYNELKSDLIIDNLILIGTPIQSETSQFILSPIFKKIYNFYSNNDMVQVIDILSTQDSKSGRRFKNTTPLQNLLQIELKLGKKHPAHNEFWLFGNSSNWLYRHKISTYPIPIFMFIPAIINFIETGYPNTRDLTVNIGKNDENFVLKLKDKNKHEPKKCFNLPAKIFTESIQL